MHFGLGPQHPTCSCCLDYRKTWHQCAMHNGPGMQGQGEPFACHIWVLPVKILSFFSLNRCGPGGEVSGLLKDAVSINQVNSSSAGKNLI